MDTQQRHIPLEGTHNLRDVGGYAALDKVTRWNCFYRSDALHALNADSADEFVKLGIRTVIDLRHAKELDEAPNVFAADPRIRYVNVSLFDELYAQARQNGEAVAHQPPTSLLDVYKLAVDHCHNGIRTVFEVLAEAESEPVLVHCTAGKDRTGIIIALLLKLAGVSEADIAKDYALTGQYISPILQALRERAQQEGQDMARYEKMLLADPQEMLDLMDYLETSYGGAEAYLLSIGVTADQVGSLRSKLLEK